MANYHEELEKIANEAISPEDANTEPMVEETQPQVSEEEVERTQATGSEEDEASEAERQQPASPEEVEALKAALQDAEAELATAKEAAENKKEEFEKISSTLSGQLPQMGALAKLIEVSTNEEADESLRKLAQERLSEAFQDQESLDNTLNKTAEELFETQENVDALYSDAGVAYVTEQLASYSEDEELQKQAFDVGGIARAVKDGADEFVDATKRFWQLKDEVEAANEEVARLHELTVQKGLAANAAEQAGDGALQQQLRGDIIGLGREHLDAVNNRDNVKELYTKGAVGKGLTATGLTGGGMAAGAGLHAATHPTQDQLSEKTASGTIDPVQIDDNGEGGNTKMAENELVKDFLKVAGASVLLDVANDENQKEEFRKEAAETFNAIARMGRADMEENLVKVATNMFTEDQLHEIVAGKHNDTLFDKVAFFTNAYDMSAEELEKVAGAEGVAAKGVGGALTDAKKNIEEKIDKDKVKTEQARTNEEGPLKATDMRGYNVINSPGEYTVEKSAEQAMLEEAYFRKEAAYKAFIEADHYIKENTAK